MFIQELKRKTSMEAELKCLRAVGTMEERLRNACNAPDATFDNVIKVCLAASSMLMLGRPMIKHSVHIILSSLTSWKILTLH